MPTIAKKSGVEISGSMSFTAKEPDNASASVPDTLAALRVNPEIGLTLFIILPAVIFAPVAAGIPEVLVLVSRGRRLPHWIRRLPIVGLGLRTLAEATPGIAHDGSLISRCIGLQVAVFLLDAGTALTVSPRH
jgi:hypothetical protein